MYQIKAGIEAMVAALVAFIALVINQALEGVQAMVAALVAFIALVINQVQQEDVQVMAAMLVALILLARDHVKAHTKGAITIGVKAFLAVVIAAVVIFASISYDEEQYWKAIVSTGFVSALLLAVQTVGATTWQLHTWNLKTGFQTIIVGLATHYSALAIGVSFGNVYVQETSIADKCNNDGNLAWFGPDMFAVLAMQLVLTGAAFILVHQFRQRKCSPVRQIKCSPTKAVAHKRSMHKCRD